MPSPGDGVYSIVNPITQHSHRNRLSAFILSIAFTLQFDFLFTTHYPMLRLSLTLPVIRKSSDWRFAGGSSSLHSHHSLCVTVGELCLLPASKGTWLNSKSKLHQFPEVRVKKERRDDGKRRKQLEIRSFVHRTSCDSRTSTRSAWGARIVWEREMLVALLLSFAFFFIASEQNKKEKPEEMVRRDEASKMLLFSSCIQKRSPDSDDDRSSSLLTVTLHPFRSSHLCLILPVVDFQKKKTEGELRIIWSRCNTLILPSLASHSHTRHSLSHWVRG